MSNKNQSVGGYELQPEVLLVKGRIAKVYLPYLLMGVGADKEKLYWVKYIDAEGDVDIVRESDLKPLKNGKILYAK